MSRLAAAVALLALVMAIVGGFAINRADRALALWKCHAQVGYGHPAQLDECLETR